MVHIAHNTELDLQIRKDTIKDTINCPEKAMKICHFNHIMIEFCYFSLDQWEIRIHLLWGKCFNIPHLNQTKFNDLLPLTIHGVLESFYGIPIDPIVWILVSSFYWTGFRFFEWETRRNFGGKTETISFCNPVLFVMWNVTVSLACTSVFFPIIIGDDKTKVWT